MIDKDDLKLFAAAALGLLLFGLLLWFSYTHPVKTTAHFEQQCVKSHLEPFMMLTTVPDGEGGSRTTEVLRERIECDEYKTICVLGNDGIKDCKR